MEREKQASPAKRAANPNQCLDYDRKIVRHLSVSKLDRSLNEIVFTKNVNLLIVAVVRSNVALQYFKIEERGDLSSPVPYPWLNDLVEHH